MSSFEIKVLGLTLPIKNITTNPQRGEIDGEMGNFISHPKKWLLRVFVQNTPFSFRGVVFVVAYINPMQKDVAGDLPYITNPFAKSLLKRQDLFSEIKS